jgi:DNA-binding transcriptional regulator YiaG
MDAGMLQKEIAAKLGVSVGSIRNWETDRHPPSEANRARIIAVISHLKSIL